MSGQWYGYLVRLGGLWLLEARPSSFFTQPTTYLGQSNNIVRTKLVNTAANVIVQLALQSTAIQPAELQITEKRSLLYFAANLFYIIALKCKQCNSAHATIYSLNNAKSLRGGKMTIANPNIWLLFTNLLFRHNSYLHLIWI